MYIYELPFEINKELCRLLDNNDIWKELAGEHMKYSPFDINGIEQEAKRHEKSPTNLLFIRWGQLNHRVEELFILLYHMKHVPALRSLVPLVDERFHRLLKKCDSQNVHGSGNRTMRAGSIGTDSCIPIPVMLIRQGGQVPSLSKSEQNGNSPSISSNSESNRNTSSNGDVETFSSEEKILKNVSTIPKMDYDELREATNNWCEDNILGKGGFGLVYKGVWKLLPVAVKRLKGNDIQNKELVREMCLNQYRYDNILPLYGYSLKGSEACLVYQLMAGGSLEQRLRGKKNTQPFTWNQRYKIAHGVARGLQFLHTTKPTPLIHGDIKPANILLDQCLMPKIGDFGLARKGPYGEDRTHMKVSKVYGTRPYLPDEYLRFYCLSTAVDVFSYGVVVAEMATALKALDSSRAEPLLSRYIHTLVRNGVDLATQEDPAIRGTKFSDPQMCQNFVAIGALCTHGDRLERPTMVDVFKRLDAMEFAGKHDI